MEEVEQSKRRKSLIFRTNSEGEKVLGNHAVKRFKLEKIFGGSLIKHKSPKIIFSKFTFLKENIKESEVPHEATSEGMNVTYPQSLSVSSAGDKLWGFHLFRRGGKGRGRGRGRRGSHGRSRSRHKSPFGPHHSEFRPGRGHSPWHGHHPPPPHHFPPHHHPPHHPPPPHHHSDFGFLGRGFRHRNKGRQKAILMMYNFDNKKETFYDFKHQRGASAMMIAEDRNLAITVGVDFFVVLYNLAAREVIKTLELEYGAGTCLFRIKDEVAVGDGNSIWFIDLKTKDMVRNKEVKIDGEFVSCIQSVEIRKDNKPNQQILFIGGKESKKLNKITLSEEGDNQGKILELIKRTCKNKKGT